MYIFNTLTVLPKLPKNIEGLDKIANNLWWTWNTEYLELFKLIDKDLWNRIDKNPIKFMKLVSQEKLEIASNDKEFVAKYEKVKNDFNSYMDSKNTYYNKNYGKDKCIAYFSAEYGLDETMPIYSGGLGILSGDHLKSSSDLGIPLVAVGMLYKEGYFTQKIDGYGNQLTSYVKVDIDNMPIFEIKDENEEPIFVKVEIDNKEIYCKLYELQVGRIRLILLDTDNDKNTEYRELTHRLYGGDKVTRIAQEIVLGIGGVRALKKLGYEPDVYHMNEGHSAFLILECIRNIMKEKQVSFNVAKEIVISKTAFTTHTAVPAGIDIFDIELIKRMFSQLPEEFGITEEEFLGFGMTKTDTYRKSFNMGYFALKFSGKRNGVSKLHGKVSRELFKEIWPNTSENEVPITHVTNGVHTCTWLAPGMKKLLNEYLKPFWQEELHKDSVWKEVYNIPNEVLSKTHREIKKKLIREIKKNIKNRYTRNYESYEEINETLEGLKETDLIIGFARRFATYKRATMIFEDLERLTNLLNDETKPVKLVFAGKAHPADLQGQELIKRIQEIAKMPQFKGKILLLENYNMAISRYLISGVDVWLNTPRRPYEASGTSGQKAAVNAAVNFSVLDGWWEEGYNGKNGFTIGTQDTYSSNEEQDKADSDDIYDKLEYEIIPEFFERDENGISEKWINRMKETMATNSGKYSANRMLIDYLNDIYMPLSTYGEKYFNNLEKVLEFRKFKKIAKNVWDSIVITNLSESNVKISAGEKQKVVAEVNFGNVKKEHAKVEAYVVKIINGTEIVKVNSTELKEIAETENGRYVYEGEIEMNDGGNYAYTFRVIPKHEMLINEQDLDLAKWLIKE